MIENMKNVTFDENKWRLVPVEPTNAMLGEAFKVDNKAYAEGSQHVASIEECWIAMVEAAPSPDQKGE